MPAPFSYPNQSTIGMVEIFNYLNNALGGTGANAFSYILTTGIVLITFAIILIFSMNNFNPESSLAVASYVSFILSIIFFYAGLLGVGFPALFAFLSAIGTGYLWYKNK
jgi:hypothetical protein